jgi:hypothetical protein
MYAGREFTIVDGTGEQERQRQIAGSLASVTSIEPEKEHRTIALRDAVGIALVILGTIGLAVCAEALWGIWGLFLALSAVAIVMGLVLGTTD